MDRDEDEIKRVLTFIIQQMTGAYFVNFIVKGYVHKGIASSSHQ